MKKRIGIGTPTSVVVYGIGTSTSQIRPPLLTWHMVRQEEGQTAASQTDAENPGLWDADVSRRCAELEACQRGGGQSC